MTRYALNQKVVYYIIINIFKLHDESSSLVCGVVSATLIR